MVEGRSEWMGGSVECCMVGKGQRAMWPSVPVVRM